MIIVKLVVLLVNIKAFCICEANYCEICPSHTLCKYTKPGPGNSCKGYDKTALLTSNEIRDIVERINVRRRFIAMGFSKILPQAANMRKIRWSEELAAAAQRWVDQCDESIRPDRKDECRDLAETKVGQNIATITGPSPGLEVRSFVEIWFMQTLDYSGSVIFYNESRDYKTNHFTQLIWAETESVGCGKARFYASNIYSIVERLVCNFAPAGNIHRKPVYSIGIPGTQCPQNMESDDTYPGLCNYQSNGDARTVSSHHPSVSSLLRILNLSNNSMKHEIDPIRNNLKQINLGNHKISHQRIQKNRHAYLNNSHVAKKRVPAAPNFWNSHVNISRDYRTLNHPLERGHSRVFHGIHETPRDHFPHENKGNIQNFRRYDYTAETMSPDTVQQDYRKYNQYHQCTRKRPALDCCVPNECETNKCAPCTRGQRNECYKTKVNLPVTPISCLHPPNLPSQNICSCNKHQYSDCPTSLPCCHINKYPGVINNCALRDPNLKKAFKTQDEINHQNKDETMRPSGLHHYDLFPNLEIRSGDKELLPAGTRLFDNDRNDEHYRNMHKGRHMSSDQNQKQVKDVIDYHTSSNQDRDYLYGIFPSSERKRREDQTEFKPFWRMDNIDQQQLKAIRYTTLSNRRNKLTRRTSERSIHLEPITVLPNYPENNPYEHVTEKYLSFEELMHLRKVNPMYIDNDGRRFVNNPALRKNTATTTTKKAAAATKTKKVAAATTTKKAAAATTTAKATVTKTTATTTKATTRATTQKTEMTTDTVFVRLKHCTRKLTCTWSAITRIDKDGNVLIPGTTGDGLDTGGPRTRHGFVDGCTRTSTCTREFMNRNRFSTGSGGTEAPEGECDGEYCERRSLNVERKHSIKNLSI